MYLWSTANISANAMEMIREIGKRETEGKERMIVSWNCQHHHAVKCTVFRICKQVTTVSQSFTLIDTSIYIYMEDEGKGI